MKISKIPFCKTLPDSWKEIPNRYLFEEHSMKVGKQFSEYQLLSLTTAGVKEKDANASGGKVPESYDNYQTVEKGDMIFCLFDLDCSAVFSGLSNYNGMITSAYDVFRPNPKYVNQHYLDYWFQYVFSNRYYRMYSKNIRYTVTREMFNSIHTPVPSLAEQKKIGELLDKKCAQIDALISNQERQIEKLKQYKQALITEVVTKGLDPTVPMKDSGIEWIGKIPEHWEEIQNRYLFEEHSAKVGKQFPKYQLLSLTTAGIKEKDAGASGGKVPESYDNYQTVKKGDVVFCLFDLDCSAVFSGLSNYDGMITSAYDVLRPNPKYVEQHFLDYWFQYVFSNRYYKMYSKNIRYTVTREMFNSIQTPVPSLSEQKKIGDFLDKKCTQINALILNQERKIEKLNQYKKSLIYEYVTGKKEVV